MAPPKVARAAPAPAATKSPAGGALPSAPEPAATLDDDLESLDFTGITLQEEKDPIDAATEEAAIAFANGDAAQCESILRESIQAFQGLPGTEVLWLMLFDAFRMTNQREAFQHIELEYAKRFEKQPPVWKNMAAEAAAAGGAAGATLFKGELVAANAASLEAFAQAVEKADKPLRYDFSKIKAVDAPTCDRVIEILARAKKLRKTVEILGVDGLIKLLDPFVQARDMNQGYWRLLLECYQRQAKPETFDEIALEFAITFELSPPAYEAPPASAKKNAMAEKPIEAPKDGAFYLRGELLGGGKVDGLDAYLGAHDHIVIDMSGVARIDFSCAGVLFSALQPCVMRKLPVTLRYPNYLVAALLRVVGLADIATIVPPKT